LRECRFTDIARRVFKALIALGLEDLDAGPRTAGYVESSEAAWAVIENVTAPYFRDLERRMKLRHEDEATALCKGIVLGLYRAEQRGFELLHYAEDAPSELAGQAGATWQRRRRHLSLSRTFIEKFTPEWDWLASLTKLPEVDRPTETYRAEPTAERQPQYRRPVPSTSQKVRLNRRTHGRKLRCFAVLRA